MAVSATSSQVPQERYDVFISYKSEDVRLGFHSHLTKQLQQEGIHVYVDEMLGKGDEMLPRLLEAIKRSKIALVIFSENYASSSWCLDVLVKIMECRRDNNQLVIPIFYDVEPSLVWHLKGAYAYAFALHEQKFEDNLLRIWRSVLIETACLSGFQLSNFPNESNLIDGIIKTVVHKKRVDLEKDKVFISFRGSDVRYGFLSHLTKQLLQKWIHVHADEMLERGDEISTSLKETIEGSTMALVIFSKGYASSRWCLEELVKIMECKRDKNQIVIPIFYHVDPSHVRHQEGSYADAFAQHEQNFKDDLMKLQVWKSVLKEIADLSGYHSSNFLNEPDLIDGIVKDVYKKLEDKGNLRQSAS
ncbi:hypothetical protein QN277_022398 [Acacia crassicarpa]|uniref:TIR domain-containing protein n=1 Tax=Acacia crassicarpa TaxID=499986 RepID=A0AAE1KBJ9_9FABA|nr:hypothetical protein QN277_022398 [Acacia crassicarpa]